MDLVILCGGRGSRLKELTRNIPKPLIKICRRPFLDHLVSYYKKYNIENVYFLAGYRGNIIKRKYDGKIQNCINFKVVVEKQPLGTGGALSLVKKKIKNDFLLINGDSFVNFNFKKFIRPLNGKSIRMLLVKKTNYASNKTLSNLAINKKKKIINFKLNSNLMNAGIYYVSKKIINTISKNKNISLENQILPKLIENEKVEGDYTKDYFIDIGLKTNLKKANSTLFKTFTKKAAFLDRDGVLNYDKGYIYRYKDFKWMPESLKALRFLNYKNYYIFIVTNQSGIARGYFNINAFYKLHTKIKKTLDLNKIYIDDIEFCPHHPKFGIKVFKKKCMCRKPGNLMIKNIRNNWNIDFKNSFMIGDQLSDFECAKSMKLKFYFREKNLLKQLKNIVNK